MRKRKSGFTLVELMVVLAVIGILMTSVFKLMSAVSNTRMDSETRAKLERIQNALSGYYAAYGCYPPVPLHELTDPGQITKGTDGSVLGGSEADFAKQAELAARAQPVSFEYPNPEVMNSYINERFAGQNAINANEAVGNMQDDADWQKAKVFKFGLLSFLLPRVEVVRFPGMDATATGVGTAPRNSVFETKQWGENNKASGALLKGNQTSEDWKLAMKKQQAAENETAAKWMPNFESILACPKRDVLGVRVQDPRVGSGGHFKLYDLDGTKVVLMNASVVDGWGKEFFYFSPPPYQSYRLWSAGPNQRTYPPWIAPKDWTSKWRTQIAAWVSDDVVGGSGL